MNEERILSSMAFLRFLSGFIEIVAALAILKFGQIAQALQINAILGLVGPIVFLLVSALGIIAIAIHLSSWKIVAIIIGILLIVWGTSGS